MNKSECEPIKVWTNQSMKQSQYNSIKAMLATYFLIFDQNDDQKMYGKIINSLKINGKKYHF